jgi:hypothetical protein
VDPALYRSSHPQLAARSPAAAARPEFVGKPERPGGDQAVPTSEPSSIATRPGPSKASSHAELPFGACDRRVSRTVMR